MAKIGTETDNKSCAEDFPEISDILYNKLVSERPKAFDPNILR